MTAASTPIRTITSRVGTASLLRMETDLGLYVRWCGWHRLYRGRPKLLGIRLTTCRVWTRDFWRVHATHGMCDACFAQFLCAVEAIEGGGKAMRRRVELVLEVDADLPEMVDAAFALLVESLAVAGIERGPFKVLATIICRVRPSRLR